MPNFFTENSDILFHFENLHIEDIVELTENFYEEAKEYNYAPINYIDAIENYKKIMEIVGDIAGNFIAPRATEVDEQGNTIENGKVVYAKGTQENLKQLVDAELMSVEFQRKFGGLNFPKTIYMMMLEIVSRADASLMNIFGLQDIAMTIEKFGDEEQKKQFMPGFSSGDYTGAMALTEPDAGSDLQAVNLHAYQNEEGQWFLRGVKRFITNGGGEVLLVLARSEPGTKDGRGLSMFACFGGDTVVVRRIENKLGIHGSPTCELQFNDTPAVLIGKRKLGLIKYVMDLMNSARLGVSAQALGISQAAYEEALAYAKAREQFGQPIYNIPPVTNMLIDMRVTLETNRSLYYDTCKWVDRRNKLELHIERLKNQEKNFQDETDKMKWANKVCNLLNPMTKYILTESSNKITYDALQIHGGAGYMKDFTIERLARDARITNIYEGTSQLQIVAAMGGVIKDILADHFDEKMNKTYKGTLNKLADHLKEIREIFTDCLKYIQDKNDPRFQDVAAKELVDLYSFLYVGFLVLDEAEINRRKIFIANRYITNALANARKSSEAIKNGQFSDLLHADEILQ
ncbi:MAG: acyl-CoA dehydrogenase family protein [Calditrichia bacterium]|nr:acyl-CoA dehydrogenase family protein [Calditrichia bacterium]